MIDPLTHTNPEIASAAGLDSDHEDGMLCLGYWRDHADPDEPGYLSLSAERAHEDVHKLERGEYVSTYTDSSDLARAGVSTRLEYFRWQAQRAEAVAQAWARLPWPGDHLDPAMPESERERVAAILDAAPVVSGYCGSSWDRLASERVPCGSTERSAGGYIWPEGLSHYVRQYGLVIDPAILAAIARTVSGVSS